MLFSYSIFAHVVEIPFSFGGKNGSMGSISSGVKGSPEAAFFNPATIGGINKTDIAVGSSFGMPKLTAPLNGDNDATSSNFSIYPLYNVAVARRIYDRVVVGFNFYPAAGMGGTFNDVHFGNNNLDPKEFSAKIAVLEASPVVAINLPYRITVGAAYRFAYNIENVNAYDANTGSYSKLKLTGMNFTGFKFGVQYEATKNLTFGASYRLPTTTTLHGDTDIIFGSTGRTLAVNETSAKLKFVDQIRCGGTYNMTNKLMVGMDFEYAFYGKVKDTVIAVGGLETGAEMHWKDRLGVYTGAQYQLTSKIPVRAGWSLTTPMTPKEYANPLSAPPAMGTAFTAGSGYTFTRLQLNGWYALMISSGSVPNLYDTAFAGDYSAYMHLIGLEVKWIS